MDVVRDGCKCSQGFALVGLKVPHGLKVDSVEGKVMIECYRSPTYNMQKHVNDILHFLEKNLGQPLFLCAHSEIRALYFSEIMIQIAHLTSQTTMKGERRNICDGSSGACFEALQKKLKISKKKCTILALKTRLLLNVVN